MKMCSLNDLPNEVLTRILLFLRNKDLLTVRQVCYRWRAVVDNNVGVSVNIGKSTKFCYPNLRWCNSKVISVIGVSRCVIGNVAPKEVFHFRYPLTMKSLTLNGFIDHNSFMNLVLSLSALHHLSLHFVALCETRIFEGLEYSNVLESLKISNYQTLQNFTPRQTIRMLENTMIILKSVRSRCLKTLLIDLPNVPLMQCRVHKAIVSCVEAHRNTLTVLQLFWATYNNIISVPKELQDSPDDCQSLVYNEHSNILGKMPLTLKRICFSKFHELTSEEYWTDLIKQQSKLKELFYMNDRPGTWGLECIRDNAQTLVKIMVHINCFRDRSETIVDCAVFEDCVHLTHLILRGRSVIGNHDQNHLHMLAPQLENPSYLPKTIQVLSIREIVLNDAATQILALRLPHLVKLRLLDTGLFPNTGMNPDTLWEVLETKHVQELELVRCFNQEQFAIQILLDHDLLANSTRERVLRAGECNVVLHEGRYHTTTMKMFEYRAPDLFLRANEVCDVVFA